MLEFWSDSRSLIAISLIHLEHDNSDIISMGLTDVLWSSNHFGDHISTMPTNLHNHVTKGYMKGIGKITFAKGTVYINGGSRYEAGLVNRTQMTRCQNIPSKLGGRKGTRQREQS